MGLLRSDKLEQRKLAFDTISSAMDVMKPGILTKNQYNYFGQLVDFLIDFKVLNKINQ